MISVTTFTICTGAKEKEPVAIRMLADADEHPSPHIARYLNREADARIAESKLAEIGLFDTLHTVQVDKPDLVHVLRTRRWSEQDIQSAEYCYVCIKWIYNVSSVDGFDVTARDGDPRLALDFGDARRPKRRWLSAWFPDNRSMIVRRDGLERIQKAPFAGIELLPTRQCVEVSTHKYERDDPYDSSYTTYPARAPKPQHEWWQLFPQLELPRMHSSVVRIPLNPKMPHAGTIERGPGAFLNGGEPFDDFQCVWSRSALKQVGPFDIARTWETLNIPPCGSMIIMSQRAVKYFREIAGDLLAFVPVRIIED
jgi:hypothetical protein